MKKVLILAFASLCFSSIQCMAAPYENHEVLYAQNVVSRGTTRLYWSDECLTLYSGGKCVLTKGDNIRIEGTYRISDGWIILNFDGAEVSCKATIKGGYIQNISYNGHVYYKR